MTEENLQHSGANEIVHFGKQPFSSYVFLEHHQPSQQRDEFHFHTSVEINFLDGFDMVYSFSGDEVLVKSSRFTVFWAAYPHRVMEVSAGGSITNAYVSLSEFLRWPLPATFVTTLLGGGVLCSKSELDGDAALARRWGEEIGNKDAAWQSLHAMEIQARLNRLAMEGWDLLHKPRSFGSGQLIGGKAVVHFEKMLQFIATKFTEQITIRDVYEHADVSQNYAIGLFRKLLGRTIKEHITEMRIVHAKMLLTETEEKILTIALDSGFGSISPFYEAFTGKTGVSPAAFRNRERRSAYLSQGAGL